MADLNLGKQIGPLPLGAWVLIVAAGLGFSYYTSQRQGSGTSPVEADSVGTGGGQLIYDPPTTQEPEVEETNATWARQAINWLVAQGHDPSVANNAIEKFIAGQSRNSQEQALVNLALTRFGAPPEGTSPTSPPPGPTPTPTGKTPGAPTNLRQVSKSVSSVGLQWARPANAVSFDIYRAGSVDGGLGKKVGATRGSFFIDRTVLGRGRNYYYRVAAVGSNAKRGKFSNRIRAVTLKRR